MIYNGHFGHLDDIAATVRATTEALKPFKKRFDAIAVSGMSGVLVGSPVAIALDCQLVVIRKEGDQSHDSSRVINGYALDAGTRYLFIDDFVSLGTTFSRVQKVMKQYRGDVVYAGSYLYSSRVLSWDADYDDEWSRMFREYANYAA